MSDAELFAKKLGMRLKRKREELGYKQSDLADILNKRYSDSESDFLSDKQISRVESGKSSTKLQKLVKWSLALGKTPDYFLLGIDNTNIETEEKIDKIIEYLKVCSEEDVDNTLIFVKAMYKKSNK